LRLNGGVFSLLRPDYTLKETQDWYRWGANKNRLNLKDKAIFNLVPKKGVARH